MVDRRTTGTHSTSAFVWKCIWQGHHQNMAERHLSRNPDRSDQFESLICQVEFPYVILLRDHDEDILQLSWNV